MSLETWIHGFDAEELLATSQLVSRLTGIPVQPNKAIVGTNAFAHEAGIHQDGMLKNRLTYEIMTPQSVGWTETKLVWVNILAVMAWMHACASLVISSLPNN